MNPSPSFRIVDCTLREGEQFPRAAFTSEERVAIARALDAFGVDVVELTSPVASPRSAADLERIAGLGLSAQVATHVRCTPGDAAAVLRSGVGAVHLVLGTSGWLRRHSHGRDLAGILAAAEEVIPGLVEAGLEVRFSCEDAFRTPTRDVVRVAQAVEAMGAARIGLADTVGAADPAQVGELVGLIRRTVDCDIEFHGHNDGGCAVANTWAAYRAGATHLDVTVLGIGERNGIASLSGLIARAFQAEPRSVERFRLDLLQGLDRLVADAVGVEVPFNACITSPTAFQHKAGLHAKAVLDEPRAYESLDPAAFGRRREVLLGHALVGRHALHGRARELGLELGGAALAEATAEVKALADGAPPSAAEVDAVLQRHAAPAAPRP